MKQKIDGKRLVDEFLDLIDDREFAPEPWCEETIMTAYDWIFTIAGDCGEPEWWKGLRNVKKGANNTIDNCVGEFDNYHNILAQFISLKSGRGVERFIDPWMLESDVNFDRNQIIRFRVDDTVISITRGQSTDARDHPDDLDDFLNEMVSMAKDAGSRRCG